MTVSDWLLIIGAMYLGLLLAKHRILTFDKACIPFVWILAFIGNLLSGKEEKDAKTEKDDDEEPKVPNR